MGEQAPTKAQVLQQVFGYHAFRPGQEELIDGLLAHRDVLGIMPTGGGKSICYQLPALMLPGITLVVSPLISLMKDQVQTLVQLGVRGAYLNSSLTPKQLQKALDNACRGVYRIIYLAPERLNTPSIRRLVECQPISMVCVDEAHCVSQWGQDFRPSYLEIPKFIASLPQRPIVAAFTATATPRVRQDIQSMLALRDPIIKVTGFDRPNLYFEVQRPEEKFDALVACLERHPKQSGIVYCLTRKEVETVHQRLRTLGYAASRYHGGLPPEERAASQEDFIYDRTPIIVATNAFGMGIDKSNVSFVIHYNMPKDLESYYQEAGRAGRDGSNADCILLYSGRDVKINEFMIDQEEEEDSLSPEARTFLRLQEHLRLQRMAEYATRPGCLRSYLLRYFGEEEPKPCGNCSGCRRQQMAGLIHTRHSAAPGPIGGSSQVRSTALFAALDEERAKLARRNGVAPFHIFSDLTLQEMAREKPQNEFQLMQISGVTRAKCSRYGRAFLRVLSKFREEDP
jgi:ATP-dependent DNA helicase RecQ